MRAPIVPIPSPPPRTGSSSGSPTKEQMSGDECVYNHLSHLTPPSPVESFLSLSPFHTQVTANNSVKAQNTITLPNTTPKTHHKSKCAPPDSASVTPRPALAQGASTKQAAACTRYRFLLINHVHPDIYECVLLPSLPPQSCSVLYSLTPRRGC